MTAPQRRRLRTVQDQRAQQIQDRYDRWSVWWSPITGQYRAHLNTPAGSAPLEYRHVDAGEVERRIQHHENRDLAAWVRAYCQGGPAPATPDRKSVV